jgi:peptidyl-prolyl cis-trans isomerase SurA
MGIKVFKHCLQKLLPLICLHSFCDANDQLIEINRIAAKVDGSIVTWGEIERSMEQFNFTDTEKKTRAAEFIDGKVDRLLAISAFNSKGMAIPDSYIEQEYSKRLISEFNGDRRLFRDYLHSKGQTVSEYKDEIREEIVYQHMLSSRKRLKADVSPNRVESYYKENELKFKTDTRVRLREIMLIPIADEPISVLLQQANKIFREVESGKPFEELAKSYGQSRYRDKGGDWGYLYSEREISTPEIREQAFYLKEGEVSKPFTVEKSGNIAVYIMQLIKKESSGTRPLSEVRSEIESQIARDIESQEQRKWLSQVKERSFVKISLPN